MLASSSARRIGLATVAVLACTSALVPSAASAKPKAQAAQDAGSASSTPQVSSAALAAGRKKYGADVTPQQAISAYWTPERMREAKPIDEAPFLDDGRQEVRDPRRGAPEEGRRRRREGPPAQDARAPR